MTALIFGIAPAMRAVACVTVFRPGERGSAGNERRPAGRRVLVSLQVAVTLVLLFGGLLFLRTFRNLATQDLGMQQHGVVIANVFFPTAGVSGREARGGVSPIWKSGCARCPA